MELTIVVGFHPLLVGIDCHKKFSHLTAIVILRASLVERTVSTIHVESSRIVGVGAG